MPLPEVFSLEAVAKHLSLTKGQLEREARSAGLCSEVGGQLLFTVPQVEALLVHWQRQPRAGATGSAGSSVEPRAYTPATLAREWGVSAQHVRNLIRTGRLEHFALGRLIRISAKAVAAYIEATRVEPATPIRSAAEPDIIVIKHSRERAR